ncbi:hypothetical protein RND81_08G123200 [Saponaria officinalis]|uniref:Uncharacterized protein n=1 Tax=Saponaria officinalis TaxID=3572 RepID=A0AAW1J6V1_SAPOF
MRITCRTYIVVFSLLNFTAAILVALYFSTIIAEILHKLFSTSIFVHLLFNFIIIAIVSKERYRGSSSNELDAFPTYYFELEEPGETGYSDDECNVYEDDLECGGDQGMSYNPDTCDSDYDDHSSGNDYYGSDCCDEDDETSYGDDECGVYEDDLECGGDQGMFYNPDRSDSDYDDSSSGDDSSGDDCFGLDGYNEDDDGSYGETWSDEDEDEEEYDPELERRIEAFIAKVVNGWKEEWSRDNMET